MVKKAILILIIMLAFVLRFWRLGDYPALNADEAAIGYNAYSLIETGRDEHGNPRPIHFQSFNDYKPGLYFYLVLPFVKFFGLSAWSVRIPSALLGVATVYIIYLLVREFGRLGGLGKLGKDQSFALLSAALLSISPWHIHFSRGGWEVNVSTFFISLGVLLFLKAIKNPKYFTLCALSFVLSLYTYHAARVIAPLLLFGLTVIFRKKLFENSKKIVISGVVGLLLLVPLGADLAKGTVLSRASGVGLFADPGTVERINEQRGEHADLLNITPRILHNKFTNFGLAFLENWGEHYWGEFLFLTGDTIQRNKVPETGQMYLFDILFVVIGAIGASRVIGPEDEKTKKGWLTIVWWLLIAPTAAALTFQSPHALRAHNMVIPLTIISAFGLVKMIDWLKKVTKDKRLLTTYYILLTTVILWNFARYQHMYWIHMAREYPYSSQYGVGELVSYVDENMEGYEKIIVTDNYDQPYILFLFYLKYPPEQFQDNHELTAQDSYGFSTVRQFGKFEFRPIDFDKDLEENSNSLLIGTEKEIPDRADVAKEIYGTNEYKYFKVVAN